MRATHDSDGATGPQRDQGEERPGSYAGVALAHSAGRGRGLRDLDDGHVRGAEGAASGVGVAGVGGSAGPAASDLRWRRHGRRGCGDPAVRVRRWSLIANPGGRDRPVRPVAGQRAPRGSWPRGGARRPRPYISRASSRSSHPHSRRLQAQQGPRPTRGPATSRRGASPPDTRNARRASAWAGAHRTLASDEHQARAGARSALLSLLHPWIGVARGSPLISMEAVAQATRAGETPNALPSCPGVAGRPQSRTVARKPRGSSPRVGQSAAGSGGHAHTPGRSRRSLGVTLEINNDFTPRPLCATASMQLRSATCGIPVSRDEHSGYAGVSSPPQIVATIERLASS